jgi:hypothetical protein
VSPPGMTSIPLGPLQVNVRRRTGWGLIALVRKTGATESSGGCWAT